MSSAGSRDQAEFTTAAEQSSALQQPHRLLFFSLEDWNEVWRRNQFFCAELVKRYPNLEVLWVCPVADAAFSMAKGAFREILDVRLTPYSVAEFPAIKLIKPLKVLPNKIGKKLNESLIKSSIQSALATLGWQEFDVWINAQQARNYLPLKGMQKLIYDITDDWTKIPQPAQQLRYVEDDDSAMLAQSDHVIVCSQYLLDSKQYRTKTISLIANGVDNARYHPTALAQLSIPEDVAELKRPIVGYTGTLHSSRLDLDLIVALSNTMSDVTFLFVGPNCLTEQETNRLKRANVHITGPRSYQELPNYASCFDVCMTPHLVNDFTESLDPLKLYEYMSTGKPIVSTPCAGFREHASLIELARSAEQFAEKIRTSLAPINHTASGARLDWAAKQSWSSRVDRVVSILGW
jgi:teichuronic acid biosynthesis glycosyltransferase TuaH